MRNRSSSEALQTNPDRHSVQVREGVDILGALHAYMSEAGIPEEDVAGVSASSDRLVPHQAGLKFEPATAVTVAILAHAAPLLPRQKWRPPYVLRDGSSDSSVGAWQSRCPSLNILKIESKNQQLSNSAAVLELLTSDIL